MELVELFWSQLQVTEDEALRLASDPVLEKIYHYGLVDTRRISLGQWKQLFAKLPKEEGGYRVTATERDRLKDFFYKGNVKKPFDPRRLKFGPRPISWLNEIYQKVLRFETSLSLQEWNKLVDTALKPRFVRGDQVTFNEDLRDLLIQWLEAKAAPLRRLELWVQEGIGPEMPAPASPPPEKKSVPRAAHDQYQAKPEQIKKQAALDKLFYQYEQHPHVSDDEALDLLDELSNLEDEGELKS